MSVPLDDIDNDYARRVERERRRREDELLFILLGFIGTARIRAIEVAIDGFDVFGAIRNVIVGSSNRPGIVRDVARAMARAHGDGYRRVGLAAGVRSVTRAAAGPIDVLVRLYEPQARVTAEAMASAITDVVRDALLNRADDVTIRRAVKDRMEEAGYSEANASSLDLATERAIVSAHGNGLIRAMLERPDLNVTGIRHVSILDSGTTDICRERHDLMLPVDHPYWLRNVPSLHWRCRSTLRPIFGDFTPTATLPQTPPMAGFGQNPLPPFARAA